MGAGKRLYPRRAGRPHVHSEGREQVISITSYAFVEGRPEAALLFFRLTLNAVLLSQIAAPKRQVGGPALFCGANPYSRAPHNMKAIRAAGSPRGGADRVRVAPRGPRAVSACRARSG